MSLLQDAMEKCVLMDRTSQPDGRGGIDYTWTDGAAFSAAITYDTSIQSIVAQARGAKAVFSVTTSRAVSLDYNDIFRRESNGQTYRVTSKGDDKKTPAAAGLDMRQVSAEEYVITGGDAP